MPTRSVFIEKVIECPMCLVRIPAKYPNPRLYTAQKRDSDSRIVEYRWLEGYDGRVKPHYYSVWQCPQCHFSNFLENILHPRGEKEHYVREAYKKMTDETMETLDNLYSLVPKDEESFDGTVAKHLAAIYLSKLPEKEHIDHYKLGRLYLRLGWLYRETQLEASTDVTEPAGALTDVQNGTNALNSYIDSFRNNITELNKAIEKRTEERKNRGIVVNPYGTVIKSLSYKINELETLSQMLTHAVESDLKSAEVFDEIQATKKGMTSLELAIVQLKKHWPNVPTNEKEAMILAYEGLEYSLRVEKVHKTVEQAMNVVVLSVELMRRVGHYEKALDLIAHVSKGGISSKQDLMDRFAKVKSAGLANHSDEMKMIGKLSKLDGTINKLSQTRREILDFIIKRDDEKIKELIEESPDKSTDGLIKYLREKGISLHIIGDLNSRHLLKAEKKKGFFG